jgi:uncharacterized membrane protein
MWWLLLPINWFVIIFLIVMIFFIAPNIIRPLGDFLLRLFL